MPTVETIVVAPSGGDYTSLSAAIAAAYSAFPDPVSDDRQIDIQCENMLDEYTSQVAIPAFVTDATRYLRIFAAQNHGGVWGTSSYRMRSNVYTTALAVGALNVRLEGLLLELATDVGASAASMVGWDFLSADPEDSYMWRCIGRYTGAVGAAEKIFSDDGTRAGLVHARCLAYGFASTDGSARAFKGNAFEANHYIGCAAIGCDVGFIDGGAGVVVRNCLSECDIDFSGTFGAASDYNASADGSAPGSNSRTSQTFTFANAGAADYHLDGADGGALGFGTDLSADGAFADTVDIDGDTPVNFSIGPDDGPTSSSTVSQATTASAEHTAAVAQSEVVTAEHAGDGVISGSVVLDADSSPVEDALVVAVRQSDGAVEVTGVTDSSGDFALDPVTPGLFDVYVRRTDSLEALAQTTVTVT